MAARGAWPVVGYIGDSTWLSDWSMDGSNLVSSIANLENVPTSPPKPVEAKRWIVWREYTSGHHPIVTASLDKLNPLLNPSFVQMYASEGQPNAQGTIIKIEEINYVGAVKDASK
jgi:hypothetical protein